MKVCSLRSDSNTSQCNGYTLLVYPLLILVPMMSLERLLCHESNRYLYWQLFTFWTSITVHGTILFCNKRFRGRYYPLSRMIIYYPLSRMSCLCDNMMYWPSWTVDTGPHFTTSVCVCLCVFSWGVTVWEHTHTVVCPTHPWYMFVNSVYLLQGGQVDETRLVVVLSESFDRNRAPVGEENKMKKRRKKEQKKGKKRGKNVIVVLMEKKVIVLSHILIRE